MDAIQDLLDEIQRIQCLVCAFRRGREEALATGELLERLRLSPTECGRVVDRLTAEGLFETLPDPVHPLPRAVRLTDVGRAYLERWSAPLGGAAAAPGARPRG